jgi:beta-glucosidase
MMAQFGAGMGREQYLKGSNVMLGPGINLARVPWCGRNFEYQGEDPWLVSHMVPAEIAGIQSQNVSANVKHYVFNNIETDRSGMSANVPDRAAKELYYKGFQAAVDAGVGSAMCSYNRVNGTWSCEDPVSLGELRDIMGFQGWTMSDWGATHSTIPAALAGLDQDMPDGSYFGAPLAAAVANGSVPMSRIDDMVTRILTPMFALNLMTTGADPTQRNISSPARSPDHDALARTLAMNSITLLKNNGILPLATANVKNVVVFGDEDSVSGGGSGSVVRPYVITAAQGLAIYLNGPLPPAPPGNCTSEDGIDYYQQDGDTQVSANSAQACCNACAGFPGCNSWSLVKPNGPCYLKPNADGRRVNTGVISGNCSNPSPPLPAGSANVTYYSTQDGATAAQQAMGADLVVMVVATESSEGSDRTTLGFPSWMDEIVRNISAVNSNFVVVARCPGACDLSWRDSVPAILFELMPGQESGNSIAAYVYFLFALF